MRASGGLPDAGSIPSVKTIAPEVVQDTVNKCVICTDPIIDSLFTGSYDCPEGCNIRIHGSCAEEVGAKTLRTDAIKCPICRKDAALWVKRATERARTLIVPSAGPKPVSPTVYRLESNESDTDSEEESVVDFLEPPPSDAAHPSESSSDSSDSDFEPPSEEGDGASSDSSTEDGESSSGDDL
jgi:hypothetical protein